MNLAFALNSYNKTKIINNNEKYDGYEAVKFALSRAIEGMEKLKEEMPTEQKEKYFEQALTSIYFLQKCLDFEKGGELAKISSKFMSFAANNNYRRKARNYSTGLDNAIEFAKTISEGWDGIRAEINNKRLKLALFLQ